MRTKELMNRGWLFYNGEPAYVQVKRTTGDQTYRGSRAENARGAGRIDFDDSAWRKVTLPHDFVYENGQELVLDKNSGSTQEKNAYPRDRGSAWYRRYFRLGKEDKDKRITLMFDGAAMRTEVYVNSMLMKVNYTANIGFEVDITDIAKFDGEGPNVVAVHCDCHDYEAWYYEGGGIYRDVYLVKTDKVSVDLWGTFVHARRLEKEDWNVTVETTVRNDYDKAKKVSVQSVLIDKNGKCVATLVSDPQTLAERDKTDIVQEVVLRKPFLWSVDERNMYCLQTTVCVDGKAVDTYETPFGIREITFDPNHGCFVNGKSVNILGFANHQWNLGVGAAMSDSMREIQMRAIKEMGGNGFRTAHAPHGPATYDYCDKYGLLMLDENRVFHPSDIRIDEVERMIKRDRNHPSVAIYSLYNEEDLFTRAQGPKIFKTLAAAAKKYDPTRPFSGAMSYGIFTKGAYDGQDLIGINHQTINFDKLHKMYPKLPIFSTEAVRGPQDSVSTIEKEYVVGAYVFTAWAFNSRPLIGERRNADALGEKGAGYYYHKMLLKKDEPLAKTWPEWDLPGQEGKMQTVTAISNCEEVEVFLNGKSLGRKKNNPYKLATYKVRYQPGTIKIVGYNKGKKAVQNIDQTSGPGVKLQLVLENESVCGDDRDVAVVKAYLLDKNGNVARCDSGRRVTFSCNVAGEFIASTSIRADGFEKNPGETIAMEYGKAEAFFRSLPKGDHLVINAVTEDGLKARLTIRRKHVKAIPSVPEVANPFVLDWCRSGIISGKMDEEALMKDDSTERWEKVNLLGAPDILNGMLPEMFNPAYDLYPKDAIKNFAYHAKVKIPKIRTAADRGKKLKLYFEGIDGVCHAVVTDGKKRAEAKTTKFSDWPGHYRPELFVDCSAFKEGDTVDVWVFFHKADHRLCGVTWPVQWIYR